MIKWFISICLFFGVCTQPEVLSDFVVQISPTPRPKPQLITLLATGDVLLARSVYSQMIKRNDYLWPFAETASILRSADLTLINLETPLLESCPATDTGMIFCGGTRVVEGIVYAGIDLASIGNNHMANHGIEGVLQTKKILMDHGIFPVENTLVIKEIKGTKFGFLSYNDIGTPEEGVPWAHDAQVVDDIKRVKLVVDIVVVSFHWGEEYVSTPTHRQKQLAHLAVDSGAHLIIGNHPHWIQPMEKYKDAVIMYSHGNFIFDQEWSEETKRGVVGKYIFLDKKLVDVSFIPIGIRDYGQAYIPMPQESQEILDHLQTISE